MTPATDWTTSRTSRFGDDDLVAEDARRLLRDAPARVPDEPGHEQRRHRVEQRIAPPHAEQRAEHRSGREHVAARVLGVGAQDLAVQPAAFAKLVRRRRTD